MAKKIDEKIIYAKQLIGNCDMEYDKTQAEFETAERHSQFGGLNTFDLEKNPRFLSLSSFYEAEADKQLENVLSKIL